MSSNIDPIEIITFANEVTNIIAEEGDRLMRTDNQLTVDDSLNFYKNLLDVVDKIYRSGFVAGEKSGYTKLN